MIRINTFIVCYDICDPKRLRYVHKTMKGFGVAVQYSIFKCSLSKTNLQRMITKVQNEMDLEEDSVIIIDLGPEDGLWENRVTIIGEKKDLRADEQPLVF